MWVAHATTLFMHLPVLLGLSWFMPALPAVLVCLALWAVTSLRLQGLVRAGRRPRWVTRFVDLPVFVHWAACMLAAFVLFPLFAVAGLLARAAFFRGDALQVTALAGLASYGAGLLVAAYGSSLRRHRVSVVHVDVPIVGLAPSLDGYRIAQMSDLHIGNFDPKERGLAWADRVSSLEPDLVAVTGDLVTTGTRFYEDVADVLGALRARDGVFVSLGNHDQGDPDELARLIQSRGPIVLRNRWQSVRREAAELVVAGIDDRMTGRDDIERTLADRPHRVPTILLSHYPEFFDEAARRQVELVLSGHTHGGQIAVPFFARRASLSTLARQTRHGLHVRGPSRLYVNAGLGTTGPPFRLGIPPEITVFHLRST